MDGGAVLKMVVDLPGGVEAEDEQARRGQMMEEALLGVLEGIALVADVLVEAREVLEATAVERLVTEFNDLGTVGNERPFGGRGRKLAALTELVRFFCGRPVQVVVARDDDSLCGSEMELSTESL